MQKKTPDVLHREKLLKRAKATMITTGQIIGKLPESYKKPPSQRKSESMRNKLLRRAGGNKSDGSKEHAEQYDCHTCNNYPCPAFRNAGGVAMESCHVQSIVHRCKQCGLKVRHYVDPDVAWEYCPVCRARKGV